MTPEELEEAKSIAQGMLRAQVDSMESAKNVMDNPHFSSVPHKTKLQALREYSRLAGQEPYKDQVNVPSSKADMAKSIAKKSLTEGMASIPMAGAIALAARPKMLLSYGAAPKKVLRHVGKHTAPIAGATAGLSALRGGVSEGLRLKRENEDVQAIRDVVDRTRQGDSSDSELSSALFSRQYKSKARPFDPERAKKTSREVAGVVGADRYLVDPEQILGARSRARTEGTTGVDLADAVGEGDEVIREYVKRHGNRWGKGQDPDIEKTSEEKPPDYKDDNLEKRKQEALEAKIKKKRQKEKEQNKSVVEYYKEDPDAQYRAAKNMAKRLIR